MVRDGPLTVSLDARELVYLKNTAFLPQALAQRLEIAPTRGKSCLTVTREVAEQYRDAFTERLARAGFDADYKPTAEGRILETLIDKFFVP